MKAPLWLLAALCLGACTSGRSNRSDQSDRTDTNKTAYLFEEVAKESGLGYRWRLDEKRPLNILQTIGNGCAFLDYDSDGNLDILLVGSPPALYKGDGGGRFVEVSEEAGLYQLKGRFLGCATGDFDNDGFTDLYLSAYRGGALLRNEGGQRYRDISQRAGIPSQPWGTSAAFFDADLDGLLDLYVGNYVDFGPKTDPQLCQYGPVMGACGPRFYQPLRGRLYRNLGQGKFRDITQESGFDSVGGKALGVAALPGAQGERPSIAIANDEMPGDLMRPTNGSFANVAQSVGTAFDAGGREYGGMGVDWGDFDGDGRFDLLVATFRHEAKNLYLAAESGSFFERSAQTGLADMTKPYVAFGAKFADFDNDGHLDLAVANGHIQDNVAQSDPDTTFEQPAVLLQNVGGKRVESLSSRLPPEAIRPIVGRGLATGDYDNDGRVDLLIVDSNGAPLLLHNVNRDAGNWIRVRLQGSRSNRQGLGARVKMAADGRTLLRKCGTDGSYLSASDERVHAGIGRAEKVDVTVTFPSGVVRTVRDAPANREVLVRE